MLLTLRVPLSVVQMLNKVGTDNSFEMLFKIGSKKQKSVKIPVVLKQLHPEELKEKKWWVSLGVPDDRPEGFLTALVESLQDWKP